MKTTGIIALIVVTFIFSFCIFHVGQRSGVNKVMILQVGGLSIQIGALENLRQGNITNAIDDIEASCFAVAVCLMENEKWRDDFIGKMLFRKLHDYRRKYAGNSNEWTYTETILEKAFAEMENTK